MKEGYVCNYLGLFHVKMPFIDGLSAVKIIKMRNKKNQGRISS